MFEISWRGVVIILLALLPNLLFAVMKPKNIPNNLKDGGVIINILEHGSQVLYFIGMIFTTKNTEASFLSLYFFGMSICLITYYGFWVRYFVNGREYHLLFDKVAGIPLPMVIFPILYFLFSALWLKSISLMLLIGLFSISHIANSYITQRQIASINNEKKL